MLEFILNLGVIISLLRRIERKLDDSMSTVKEALELVIDKMNKIFDEQAAQIQVSREKIAQLEAALANRELTPEEAAALEEAKAAMQKVDDLIPDAPIEVPVDTPVEESPSEEV